MSVQESSKFYQTTTRLWPEVGQMDERRRIRAVETIVQLVYLSPFAIAGLVWLALKLASPPGHVVGAIYHRRGRVVGHGPSIGSQRFVAEHPAGSIRRKPGMGTYVLATIVATMIYLEVGGIFPITSTDANDWIPALIAIVVGALLSGVIMMPVGIQIDSLIGASVGLGSITRFYLGYVALPLIISPFAIIIALLNAEGRTISLVFILIGVWLVNRLAHHLSEADERSRQLAREFAELEALGEALIEAPADASTLGEVLASYLPRMFPVERVEILLFEPKEKTVWKPFQVEHPESMTPVADEIWTQMRQSGESTIVVPDVKLPGERFTFGDGLAAKIVLEDPAEELEPNCIGGVYILRHRSVGKTTDSLATIQSLASQVSSAIYRSEVHAETMAYHKTQQELEFAGRVQNSFLPSTIPDPDQWQITATLVPARQTSGDFYDFIPLGENLLGIIVADVSDKGTGAALYMALSRTLVRTYALESKTEPEAALTRTNDRIFTDTESDQFVTLIYGILDTSSGVLTYANAGHNPGYLLRSGQGVGESMEVEVLGNTGIPLGMFEEMAWKQAKVTMNPGDVLMLYSDGVPEAEDGDHNEYGDDSFIAVGKANAHRSTDEIAEAVLASVRDFVGDAPQFDDITLVVVARDPEG